jgi:hypothetical protein
MSGDVGWFICLSWSAVMAMDGQFGGNTPMPAATRRRRNDHIVGATIIEKAFR